MTYVVTEMCIRCKYIVRIEKHEGISIRERGTDVPASCGIARAFRVNPDLAPAGAFELSRNGETSVSGAIVDYDDLVGRKGLFQCRAYGLCEVLFCVVTGDDDIDFHARPLSYAQEVGWQTGDPSGAESH